MEPITISTPSTYWLGILRVAREWQEGDLERLDTLIELIRREFYILYETDNQHTIASKATLCNACQDLLQEFGDREAARARCDGANELLRYTKSLLQSVGVVELKVDLWIESNTLLRRLLDGLSPLPENWNQDWPEPLIRVASSNGVSDAFPALHLLTDPSRASLIDN